MNDFLKVNIRSKRTNHQKKNYNPSTDLSIRTRISLINMFRNLVNNKNNDKKKKKEINKNNHEKNL